MPPVILTGLPQMVEPTLTLRPMYTAPCGKWPRRTGAPRTGRVRALGSLSPVGVTQVAPGEPTAREAPPLPLIAATIVEPGTIAPPLIGSAG
eukprot:8432738-Heterocapsa_arctica.AAC.1